MRGKFLNSSGQPADLHKIDNKSLYRNILPPEWPSIRT